MLKKNDISPNVKKPNQMLEQILQPPKTLKKKMWEADCTSMFLYSGFDLAELNDKYFFGSNIFKLNLANHGK